MLLREVAVQWRKLLQSLGRTRVGAGASGRMSEVTDVYEYEYVYG